MATTPSNKWRQQSQANRQGSSGDFVVSWPDNYEVADGAINIFSEDGREGEHRLLADGKATPTPGQYLSDREQELHEHAQEVYKERLHFGVAKEQARKDLPLSNFTEAFWKIDLHNLLHFLRLRLDTHAQAEIRECAEVIASIVRDLFPLTYEAFEDYRLESMTLTRLDRVVLDRIMEAVKDGDAWIPVSMEEFIEEFQHEAWRELKRSRERDECAEKLRELGVLDNDLD